MKIGMVSEFYYPQPGGISEHIRALSVELRLLGHEVVVLTSNIRGDIPERHPRVIRLGRSLPLRYNGSLSRISLGWQLGLRLEEVLHREHFDLLHIHNPLMPTLPLLTISKARCPLVGTFHSYYRRDLLTQLFRPQLNRLLGRLSARVPVSRSAQRAAMSLFPGEYRVIPNGVDFSFFAKIAGQSGNGSRRKNGRPLRILFVGAFVRRKGLPHMLDAFRQIRERRNDVELLVVGDGPDRARVRRNLPATIRNAVQFVGFVPRRQLAEYYATAHVFCAPSLGSESFGMVLLEAMAAGLPVVAFDIDGYRDVVKHGHDGLLVEQEDSRALAAGIEHFLDHPEERVRYGLRGQQKAKRFSWREVALQLEELYREVLGWPQQDRATADHTGTGVAPATEEVCAQVGERGVPASARTREESMPASLEA
ncbi:MAG: glycosyltransferase family 4 protein [Candidatus Eisenbacteria sp.]|nr:glycosyltransferase family 4 protein [Candidatus Eisenbacteria bacterium]